MILLKNLGFVILILIIFNSQKSYSYELVCGLEDIWVHTFQIDDTDKKLTRVSMISKIPPQTEYSLNIPIDIVEWSSDKIIGVENQMTTDRQMKFVLIDLKNSVMVSTYFNVFSYEFREDRSSFLTDLVNDDSSYVEDISGMVVTRCLRRD